MPKVGTMLCAVPRIRKIIISSGADRARLKMSSPGRLVGQPFSSIIPGPAAERRDSLGFVHLPTDRGLSPQRLSKLVRDAMKFSPRERLRGQFRAPSIFSLSFVSPRDRDIVIIYSRPDFFVFLSPRYSYHEHEHI